MVEIPPTGRFDGRRVGTTEAAQRQPPSAAEVYVLRGLLGPLGSLSRDALESNPSSAQGCPRPPRVSNQDHPSHETYPSPVFAARDRSRRDRRRHLPLWRAPKSGGRARRASYHLEGIWGHQALALRSRGMQASAVVGTQHVARTCKTVLEGVNPHRRFGAPAIGISVVDAPRRSEQGRVT